MLETGDKERLLGLLAVLRETAFFYKDELPSELEDRKAPPLEPDDPEAGRNREAVARMVEFLERFRLYYRTGGGYKRRSWFNVFNNRFRRQRPDLFGIRPRPSLRDMLGHGKGGWRWT